MYAKVDLGGNGLGHIFTVRFIFSEIVMMATVLYYMFSILPCRRSKWKVVMIAYVSVFIYLFIMIATGKSFYLFSGDSDSYGTDCYTVLSDW